jgi:hypothetical protein
MKSGKQEGGDRNSLSDGMPKWLKIVMLTGIAVLLVWMLLLPSA